MNKDEDVSFMSYLETQMKTKDMEKKEKIPKEDD